MLNNYYVIILRLPDKIFLNLYALLLHREQDSFGQPKKVKRKPNQGHELTTYNMLFYTEKVLYVIWNISL